MNDFYLGPFAFTVNADRMAAYIGEPFASEALKIWETKPEFAHETAVEWAREQYVAWQREVGVAPSPVERYVPNDRDVFDHAHVVLEAAVNRTRGTKRHDALWPLLRQYEKVMGLMDSQERAQAA